MANKKITNQLTTTLKNDFGFHEFRPGQAEAINLILAGSNTLVVMPTGYGKSLIYQLSAFVLPHTTLVISPLISLMKDQVDSLVQRNISASFINSTLNYAEQTNRLYNLANGKFKILFIAPERLRSQEFRQALSKTPISLLAVDEAHCLSQWGHDFRPDYLHISNFRNQCKFPVTLALTATATPQVRKEIINLLGLGDMEQIITGFDRPNLFFNVHSITNLNSKFRFLSQFLAGNDGPGIIYSGTRRDAEEIAEFICEVVGKSAHYYHAGLETRTRNEVQDLFMSGQTNLVVSTNAFGMGIDRPDIRFVLHYSIPGSLEAYYQEAGRAGRDGFPAQAILIYSPDDIALQEFFIDNDSPSIEELRSVQSYISNLPISQPGIEKNVRSFHIDDLIYSTSLSEIKARVAIEYIEAAGGITREPKSTGKTINFKIENLDRIELQKIFSKIETRRRHKRALLKKMLNYSGTNKCRRRTILEYFGDSSLGITQNCCDNCSSFKELSKTEGRSKPPILTQNQLIILDTITKLRWGLGKRKVAQVLKGSSARAVICYRKHPNYGLLADLRISDIENVIQELVNNGFIKYSGSKLPTLTLSPNGEFAIQKFGSGKLDKKSILRKGKHPKPNRASHVYSLGVQGSVEHVPELILALKDTNGNVRRLAASALGKIKSCDAVEPLLELLDSELKPQVRQYSIKALGKIGDKRARPALEKIAIDYSEKEYNRIAAKNALKGLKRDFGKQSQHLAPQIQFSKQAELDSLANQSTDRISAFLNKPMPRPLKGPWLAGWALDFHSRYVGSNLTRSEIGELVFNFKYNGEHHLVESLANYMIELLSAHPELPKPNGIIPIPPSISREFDPVAKLAQELAFKLDVPAQLNTLKKTRRTQPQKELNSLIAKRRNVSGAFCLCQNISGKRLLLIDDLYDSGATLNEAASILAKGNPTSIVVLTLTKTVHSNL